MTDDEKRKAALEEIDRHVQAAYAALEEAKRIAREHGLSFNFKTAYGMGGTFTGWDSSDCWGDDGWISSSIGC